MILDIFLGIFFIASVYLLWVGVRQKVPELLAIPDSVIAERLQEDSVWIHRFFLHIARFPELYRQRHYQDKFWRITSKTIYHIHIVALKMDNAILRLLKRTLKNANGEETPPSPRHNGGEYWKQLTSDAPPPHPQVPYASEIKQR